MKQSLYDRLETYRLSLNSNDPAEREIRFRLAHQVEAATFGTKIHVPTLRGNLRRIGAAMPAPYGAAVLAIAAK